MLALACFVVAALLKLGLLSVLLRSMGSVKEWWWWKWSRAVQAKYIRKRTERHFQKRNQAISDAEWHIGETERTGDQAELDATKAEKDRQNRLYEKRQREEYARNAVAQPQRSSAANQPAYNMQQNVYPMQPTQTMMSGGQGMSQQGPGPPKIKEGKGRGGGPPGFGR